METEFTKKQIEQQHYTCAVHEAGHAVAACAVGFGMKKKGMVLRNSLVEGLFDGVAYTRAYGRRSSNPKKRELFHKNNIVITLAGPIAEDRVNPRLVHIDYDVQNIILSLLELIPSKRQFLRKYIAEASDYGDNWDDFWALIYTLATDGDWRETAAGLDDSYGIFADLSDIFGPLVEILGPFAQQARDIIKRHWSLVKQLSSELLKGQSLGRAEIDALIGDRFRQPTSHVPVAIDCNFTQKLRGMELKTVEDIRRALIDYYPDVNYDEFSIEHSGFAHDDVMFAIGVVLISFIVLGTTDPVKLAEFTNYSERFVHAVAINMESCGLRKDDKYDCSSWFSGDLMPSKEPEGWRFGEHVLIVGGSNPWAVEDDEGNIAQSIDTSSIFLDDMQSEAKARGMMIWRRGKRLV